MEAAAKTINRLSQRLLPEQPHHLSIHPDWRYKPYEDRRPDRPEEWGNVRLQYMTLLSDADRGVLLTRSYYDMREEAQKPVPKEVSALAKGGEKKKLSLSDYKNKKTTGTTSASPPEPSIAKKKDADAGAGAGASPSLNGPSPKPTTDARPSRPTNGSDRSIHTSSGSSADSKLPPKPSKHPLPPRPPTPEARKRVADPDDDARNSKRPRPESDRLAVDKARPPRDDILRRKDPANDRTPVRDGRAASSNSSLLNGRSMLKDVTGPGRSSPATHTHSRNSSLNGIRHNASATGSMRNTPTKVDIPSKTSVPPLLSPLHFDVDDMEADVTERREKKARERERERDRERDKERDNRERERERERVRDRERERDRLERDRERDRDRDRDRDKNREPRERERDRDDRPTKLKKPADPPIKRERSPVRLPPLLSPTLPPEVEEAIEKLRKKQPSSSSDDGEPPPLRELKKVPPLQLAGKKRLPGDMSEDEADTKPPPRKRYMVKLRIPKRLRKDVSRILKIGDKEVPKQERQRSPEPAPGAKKRLPAGEDAIGNESLAAKRPRTSDASALLPNPLTPSKKSSTAMSRVSSTNSQANTPGEPPSHHRPSSADPPVANGTARPPPPLSPADQARAERLRHREAGYLTLGKQLKKEGESLIVSGRNRSDTTRGKSDIKLGCVKYLEGLIAFALAFQTQYTHRQLVRQYVSAQAWSSILPAVDALRADVRRLGNPGASLGALVALLQARAYEEILKCYGTYPSPEGRVRSDELLRLVNLRAKALGQAREVLADGPTGRGGILKGVELGAWMNVEEMCEAAARVMKRWCAEEEVDWTPEVSKG